MTPFAYIDRHRGQMLSSLRDLIRIPTVNPPGEGYDEITRRLMARLGELGLTTRRYSVPAATLREALPEGQPLLPRYNVLGKWKVPGARKTIHFNAHYDVVPAAAAGWRAGGPFSGAVSRGWIYGRGTADMKGSIASLLLALESLRACGVKPKFNVEVSFTADEETDSALGTGWLVKHAPVEPDCAIVMEGGEGRVVCCGHNGVCWLEVTVHGHAAHGSQPQDGINALEKMSALVLGLEPYKRMLAKRIFINPEGRKMTPTVNLGGVFACGEGAKINTVPGTATFTIDRRVLAIERQAAAERELRAALLAAAARIPQCRISIRKISENYASFYPPGHPFLAAVGESVTKVRGEKSVFSVSTGFNDSYFFASVLKVPTVGYGPGGSDYHGDNERASVKELLASAKIYADVLTKEV